MATPVYDLMALAIGANGAGRELALGRGVRAVGTTFSELATKRKLDAAWAMLRTPRFVAWSISGIAFEAGFKDLSHFNRRFRRRFGVTPSEFKRHGQG